MNEPIINAPKLRSRFVNCESMPWMETDFPGIEMKILYKDDFGRSTILFKMEPGATVPMHRHTALEMTYMLEGTLVDDEGTAGPGSFVWRPGGSKHIARAPEGALFLSVFSSPNVFEGGNKFFTEETG